MRLSQLLPAKIVVEFQFEAVLGLRAAGKENPTYGILEREEETCCKDWRLFATQLEMADTLEVTALNDHASPLYSAVNSLPAQLVPIRTVRYYMTRDYLPINALVAGLAADAG